MPNEKLVIELSVEATEKYLAWAGGIVEGEVNADCEPSGVTISIDVAPSVFESIAYSQTSTSFVEFGEVNVDLVKV